MEIASVEAGSTININRSDGRVHPAVVVAVNQDGKFVRVEWFENGETKGKDIDFSVATMLNPNLKVIPDSLEPVVQAIDDSLVNKFQRRAIPVNNRRTNIGKRKCGINDNTFNDVKSPIEIIPKLYATRSQSKDLSVQGSIVQDLSKVERCKSERKQRQPIVNEKKENSRKCGVNGYGLLADMVSEYRGKLKFSPLLMDDAVEDHLIMVCVRKRPMNRHEINKNEVDIVSIPRKNHLIVHEPKTKVDLTKYIENHNFKFDYAFDESCDNSLVYKYTAQPLVKTIFNGGFATCFAYGQTGSGKTYTMSGDLVGSDVGIYALAISDVFKLVNSAKFKHLNLSVSCSFFEIYSGKVLDLLNSKGNLRILEDAKQVVQVVGLKEKCVVNTSEVMSLISKGNILRTSGQTSANSNSSRSHAVFQIFLRNHGVVHGKLSLIDLAGNERGADTYTADRQTRLEGGEINKSLLALKECIRALGRKGAHLPFRVSKLTQVLRDSFVGNNSRTCMIAMVSPSVCSCENTLNTLRYADRVKELGTGDTQANEPNKATSPELIESMPFIENGDNPTTELQRVEKKIFNNHKLILSKLAETEKEGHHLLMMTTNFDFDKKSYVNKYETLIDETISHLLVTKDFIDEYKTKLSRH